MFAVPLGITEEIFSNSFRCLYNLSSFCRNLLIELLEKHTVVALHLLAHLLATFLVLLFENVFGKFLQVFAYTPLLAVAQTVLYEINYLCNAFRVGFEVLYVCVYCIPKQLFAVESNLYVTSQIQLAGKAAQNSLEKGVDGLNTEVSVVVQYQLHGFSCIGYYFLVTEVGELFLYLMEVVGCTRKRVRHSVQLAKNTFLHLGCSLVCEGYSKYITVAVWVLHHQFYIFQCKGKGLSRPC